jgi:hypothetical protein
MADYARWDRVHRPTGEMGWYVDPDRHWSLIKLHGSVDWARRSMVATRPSGHPLSRASARR